MPLARRLDLFGGPGVDYVADEAIKALEIAVRVHAVLGITTRARGGRGRQDNEG